MNAGSIVIDFLLNTNNLDNQISETIAELNALVDEYEKLQQQKGFDEQSKEAQELKARIMEVTNELISLRAEYNKQEKSSGKTFKNILNNIKKIGLRMLGIASIYGIVSKASHSYLAQDTELAQKMKNVWVALGSFMAPMLEWFSDIMLKAVGYLNEFVKALTGIDFIARANAKALEKQAKAQKNLNNQTYDFDVIRTQKDNTSNNNLIEIPELNPVIVNKLKEMAEWLKENWYWIKEVGLALLAVFGAKAVGGLLSNIGSLLGVGGLGGLLTALMAVAAVWTITLVMKNVQETYKQIQEVEKSLHQTTNQEEKTKQKTVELAKEYKNLKEEGKDTDEVTKQYIKTLQNNNNITKNSIDELEKQKNSIFLTTAAKTELTNTEKEYAQELLVSNSELYDLAEQGKLNTHQEKELAKSIQTEIDLRKKLGYNVDDLQKKYENLVNKNYTVRLNADTSGFETALHAIFDRLTLGVFKQKDQSFRKYAVGGIVTQPTRAIVGEAGYPEAIVPMTDDYLGTLAKLIGQYNGGSGGGTTNVYLDGRLIQRQVSDRQNQYNFATNK